MFALDVTLIDSSVSSLFIDMSSEIFESFDVGLQYEKKIYKKYALWLGKYIYIVQTCLFSL